MVTIAMTGPPARLAYLTSCQKVFLISPRRYGAGDFAHQAVG
jgi:hypothetical protein